jgi:RNA polymerase sigma factor (sigma-70 family)
MNSEQSNEDRTRRSLVDGLKDLDDSERWKQFYQAYGPMIREMSKKAGLSHTEAEDVVQETIISVAKHMPTFIYNPAVGSFKAWLFNLILWRVKDQLRKRLPDSPIRPENYRKKYTARTSTIDRIADPAGAQLEDDWDAQWKTSSLEIALDKIKQKIKAKHFQIFQLLVVQGLPGPRVASSLGVNIGYVYLVTHRVGRLVKKQLKVMEEKGLT